MTGDIFSILDSRTLGVGDEPEPATSWPREPGRGMANVHTADRRLCVLRLPVRGAVQPPPVGSSGGARRAIDGPAVASVACQIPPPAAARSGRWQTRKLFAATCVSRPISDATVRTPMGAHAPRWLRCSSPANSDELSRRAQQSPTRVVPVPRPGVTNR
jgi:hypothetical protein